MLQGLAASHAELSSRFDIYDTNEMDGNMTNGFCPDFELAFFAAQMVVHRHSHYRQLRS